MTTFVPPTLQWLANPTLRLIYLTTFFFGFTAIAHENNPGATASLIAGDSATQYGWIIGLTLLGLGIGFRISASIADGTMVDRFIDAEILLTLVSGFSVLLAFQAYIWVPDLHLWLIRLVALAISALVGPEAAIQLRVAARHEADLRSTVGWTFWFSNLGGGIAGFTFGKYLVPGFGIFELALLLGLLDGLFVLANVLYFRDELRRGWLRLALATAVTAAIAVTTMRAAPVSRSEEH